jgi:hypothetical protein
MLSGVAPCDRMWMQVLKKDAVRCRVGGTVTAMGIMTSDVENSAWQINPVHNEFMIPGDDFSCR